MESFAEEAPNGILCTTDGQWNPMSKDPCKKGALLRTGTICQINSFNNTVVDHFKQDNYGTWY